MTLELIVRLWKPSVLLIVMGVCFYAGRQSAGWNKAEESSVENTTEVGNKTTINQKVTTTKVLADGTQETKIVEVGKTTEKTASKTKKESETEKPVITDLRPNFSASAMVQMNSDMERSYQVMAGWRALGNIWLEAGYDTQKAAVLGVTVGF